MLFNICEQCRSTTNAWEQRELSAITDRAIGGGTPNTKNLDFWAGHIPWIQSSDLVSDSVLTFKVRKYISEAGLLHSAAKRVPENSILIVTRVGFGKIALTNQVVTTSQDFLSLTELKEEPVFLLFSIYQKLNKELAKVQGTSIKGITKSELLSKNIFIPKKEEQQKISRFFVSLENLITLHQRKQDF